MRQPSRRVRRAAADYLIVPLGSTWTIGRALHLHLDAVGDLDVQT